MKFRFSLKSVIFYPLPGTVIPKKGNSRLSEVNQSLEVFFRLYGPIPLC